MAPNDDPPVQAARSGRTLPGPPYPAPTETPRVNVDLFADLMDRFSVLAETCARFSQYVYHRTGVPTQSDVEGTIRRNLDITHAVFSEWSIDILTVLHFRGTVGFDEIGKVLGKIPGSVLVRKLDGLEKLGLVQRDVAWKATRQARYTLTHKGSVIAQLGEPVFLYLRLASGWFAAVAEGSRDHEEVPLPAREDARTPRGIADG